MASLCYTILETRQVIICNSLQNPLGACKLLSCTSWSPAVTTRNINTFLSSVLEVDEVLGNILNRGGGMERVETKKYQYSMKYWLAAEINSISTGDCWKTHGMKGSVQTKVEGIKYELALSFLLFCPHWRRLLEVLKWSELMLRLIELDKQTMMRSCCEKSLIGIKIVYCSLRVGFTAQRGKGRVSVSFCHCIEA